MKPKLWHFRWIGLALLLFYWSSIVWLPFVFDFFGVDAKRSTVLISILEVYYWLPKKVLGLFIPILPYPEFMFYGPILSVVIPAVLLSFGWWFLLTARLKNPASA